MTHPFGAIGVAIIAALGAPSVITVRSFAAGAFDDSTGRWVQGASTETPRDAVVQPSTPREIRQLPELERYQEAITIFTLLPLQTGNSAGLESDVVLWDSREWKVQVSEDWVRQAGYARAVATRIGV